MGKSQPNTLLKDEAVAAKCILTSILVCDYLGLVVDSEGDGAVGVAKGDANDGAILGRSASLGD